MNKKSPIGIFDSGVGGLTVTDKVLRSLPKEEVIYFGDTARIPYGNKSKETVTRFSKEVVRFLLRFKVKLIIVACNTASSLSLRSLQHLFRVPIIGVIKPGAEEAASLSKTGRIGVIGTPATVASNAYKTAIKAAFPDACVVQEACPLFVPLVECGWCDGEIASKVAKKYLSSVLVKKIDTLILGCTHYPLLKKVIKKTVGKDIKLVDSSAAVAGYARKLLEKRNMLSKASEGGARFFASDDTKNFIRLAKVFLKRNIKAEKVVL